MRVGGFISEVVDIEAVVFVGKVCLVGEEEESFDIREVFIIALVGCDDGVAYIVIG